jgi:hypothetical protein
MDNIRGELAARRIAGRGGSFSYSSTFNTEAYDASRTTSGPTRPINCPPSPSTDTACADVAVSSTAHGFAKDASASSLLNYTATTSSHEGPFLCDIDR